VSKHNVTTKKHKIFEHLAFPVKVMILFLW